MENINPVTEPVKEIKMYLKSFGSKGISQDVLESAVLKVLKRCANEDKAFLHMALFFHVVPVLDSTLMDDVQDDPEDFLGLLPPVEYPGLPLELYCRLVIDGGLTQHFFQMLTVLPEKYNVAVAVNGITEIMLSDAEEYYDVYLFALSVLVNTARPTGVTESIQEEVYSKCLMKLVEKYMSCGILKRHEQLTILLQLAGVCCMMKDEYQSSNNDLGELLEEYDFDLSQRVAIDTRNYFTKLFKTQISGGNRKVCQKNLEFLSETLKQLDFLEQEAEEFRAQRKTSKVSWLDYVGITAFLTKSIIEKRDFDEEFRDRIEVIINESLLWSKYRPKITIEDFQKDVVDFNKFFIVIRKFGQKENVRTELLNQFLTFSYSDIFLKKEGLKITDKYLIPGADYDLAVQYIKKSINTELMPAGLLGVVPEIVKIAVLKIIGCNQNVKEKRTEVVREIFNDGTHSHFSLNSFPMDITQVCTKLGSMEKETDSKQIEHNRDLIFNVCFQNPSSALESVLTQAIRSQQFKALEMARPFFHIVSRLDPQNRLVEECFKKLLETTDESDPLIASISTAIPSLLHHNILDAEKMFYLLKSVNSELMNRHEVVLEKVGKLFQIMECLAKASKDCCSSKRSQEGLDWKVDLSKVLQQIGTYATEITAVTCIMLSKKTFKPLMSIRRTCLTITSIISKDSENELALDSEATYPLESLGLLYIREPRIRLQILLHMDQVDPKSVTYEEGVDLMITWAMNSEPSFEWESVIEFFQRVFFPKFQSDWGVNHPMDLINQCTYVIFEFSLFADDQVFIRQWLKFYKQIVTRIWKRKKAINSECQLSILRTLVTLSIAVLKVAEIKEKSRAVRSNLESTMQQLLLLVLDMVNIIVAKNSHLEVKEEMLDIITLLPNHEKKYSNIFRCITERVLKERKSKMLPMPTEEDDETRREDEEQHDVIINAEC